MIPLEDHKICLVGNPEESHVGSHMIQAATALGIRFIFKDVQDAFRGSLLYQRFLWRCFGKRPQNLNAFSTTVLRTVQKEKCSCVIAIGIAPINAKTLTAISLLGIPTLNFLTDDPWNYYHKAPWFFRALAKYTKVYSPRFNNISDLINHGCGSVRYLPFAYAPAHLINIEDLPQESGTEVLFVGGGDNDRVEFARRLLKNGVKLTLYGSAWNRFPDLKNSWMGMGGVDQIRRETASAKITLCLVRRANRDGHVMRSFEAAASGGCMVVEDTPEHRQIFGKDNHCVLYFDNLEQMTEKIQKLLANSDERLRLRKAVYKKITSENNTYKDRLLKMVGEL